MEARLCLVRFVRLALVCLLVGCNAAATQLVQGNVFSQQPPVPVNSKRVKAVSWNVAAVNNNPFEYWITHPNPAYKKLMEDVEKFIVAPGSEDVEVNSVFTDAMFEQLVAKMKGADLGVENEFYPIVSRMWKDDYRGRKVVSQFLQDAVIGKKRLASMPDRVSNTIQLASGEAVFRPTVINCYPQELGTLENWFQQWLTFFFDTTVDLGKGPKKVYSLLQPIKQAKYPAITEEEEKVSIPLQLVLAGVFDAILVDLMQKKAGSSWNALRKEICTSLNNRKNTRLMEILDSTYKEADIVFLQEAGNQLVKLIKEKSAYEVVLPKRYNAKRNQNSVILLNKGLFGAHSEIDVKADGWDDGDLLAVSVDLKGVPVTLASFHGDTNGLLTKPMLTSFMEQVKPQRLLFGMDANTHEKVSSSTAYVVDFANHFESLGLKSSWGDVDPARYTTFNARTYLQPQLNKAAKSNELAEKGDRNPKDFMLHTGHFTPLKMWRDNTGLGEYTENMVFPTLQFPSDHAAIAADYIFESGANTEL